MIAYEPSIQDNLTDKIWWGYCEKCGPLANTPSYGERGMQDASMANLRRLTTLNVGFAPSGVLN